MKRTQEYRCRYRSIPASFLLLLSSHLFAQKHDIVCATCHPSETRAFQSSSMARSLGIPEAVPVGAINDSQSGSSLQAEWRGGKLFHRLKEDGLSTESEIRYQIGAGKVGHSYAVLAKCFLVQSPASYFTKYGWDWSPGYSGAELIDFDRVLTDRCLFCHSNSPNAYRVGRLREDLAAINCQRCHGDPSEHVTHPSAGNIVNPSKLPRRARDSICEQCHLEGIARVLNPGKTLSDYKPGMNLEDTLAIYVAKQSSQSVRAVSQEEELAQSRCALESRGRLWCGTCHNPHVRAKNRAAEVKAICASCHPTLSPAKHSAVAECTSCHMATRAPTDVIHAALTDHRISKPAEQSTASTLAADDLRAWYEPVSSLQQRDLALAYLEAAKNHSLAQLAAIGTRLLNALPPAQQESDAAVSAALGSMRSREGRLSDALALLRRARELEPASGEYAMSLGLELNQNADLSGAERELKDAIQLDPSLQRAYLGLSELYTKEGKLTAAKEVLQQYLDLNPHSILVQLSKQALANSSSN